MAHQRRHITPGHHMLHAWSLTRHWNTIERASWPTRGATSPQATTCCMQGTLLSSALQQADTLKVLNLEGHWGFMPVKKEVVCYHMLHAS